MSWYRPCPKRLLGHRWTEHDIDSVSNEKLLAKNTRGGATMGGFLAYMFEAKYYEIRWCSCCHRIEVRTNCLFYPKWKKFRHRDASQDFRDSLRKAGFILKLPGE